MKLIVTLALDVADADAAEEMVKRNLPDAEILGVDDDGDLVGEED